MREARAERETQLDKEEDMVSAVLAKLERGLDVHGMPPAADLNGEKKADSDVATAARHDTRSPPRARPTSNASPVVPPIQSMLTIASASSQKACTDSASQLPRLDDSSVEIPSPIRQSRLSAFSIMTPRPDTADASECSGSLTHTSCSDDAGFLPGTPTNAVTEPADREHVEELAACVVQVPAVFAIGLREPDGSMVPCAPHSALQVLLEIGECSSGDCSSSSYGSPTSLCQTSRTQVSLCNSSCAERRPLQEKNLSELAQEAAQLSALAKSRAVARLSELGLNCETVSGRSTPLVTPRPYSLLSARSVTDACSQTAPVHSCPSMVSTASVFAPVSCAPASYSILSRPPSTVDEGSPSLADTEP